jgi:hypothetical protein
VEVQAPGGYYGRLAALGDRIAGDVAEILIVGQPNEFV